MTPAAPTSPDPRQPDHRPHTQGLQVSSATVSTSDTTLLNPVSVHISPGEILAVRGPNGSGKTTLLRLIAGTLRPTGGTITLDGRVISDRDPVIRQRISAMTTPPPLALDLTILEHLCYVARSWSADPEAAQDQSVALLTELNLLRFSTRLPHELSSGQRHLFSIALHLARPFDVLILDEPEQRLDPHHTREVGALIQRRQSMGVTVVLSTHSDALTQAIATDEVWLGAPA